MVSQSQPGCDGERAASAASEPSTERALLGEAWGALNFILAFYEPGQRYLDTNAWTQAEASGRRVHKAIREYLDAPTASPEGGQVQTLDEPLNPPNPDPSDEEEA